MRTYHILLTLFFPFIIMAQNQPIDKLWKEVDHSMNNGQFKSFEPKMDEIKSLALKSNDDANFIKALFYDAKIKVVTTEETDDVNFVFETFSKEINGKSMVRDAVVQMYLAKLYSIYYNENEYKISSRTEVENQSSNDVRFWTSKTFNSKIDQLFKQTIQPKNELLKENIQNWKPLLVDIDSNSDTFKRNLDLTPTLYDVLMHEYISYLAGEFNFSDSDKRKEKANQYLQELAKLNSDKGQFNAFLLNQNKQLTNRRNEISTEDFLKEKEQLASIYFKETWYSTTIYASLVDELMNDEHLKKVSYKKIFEIEQKVKSQYPKEEQTKFISKKVEEIKAKSYSFIVENYVLPNQNIPIKIKHKNTSKLYVRIYPFDQKFGEVNQSELMSGYDTINLKKVEKYIKNLKLINEYSIDLKSFDDYQSHASFYKLNPLSEGNYLILISSDQNFDVFSTENPLFYSTISATNYVINFNKNQVYLANRKTGQPIANKPIEVLYHSYDSTGQFDTITTDKDGKAQIFNNNSSIYLRVKGDAAIYTSYYRNYYKSTTDEPSLNATILTDRGIYRPNQIIHFKTIVYKTIKKESEVLPNSSIDVFLRDANGKEIAKINGTTNEFGSFSGNFQIPASVLTGNFNINVVSKNGDYQIRGYKSIRVEEYKRPKFEVKVNELKGVYKLNDKVNVTGKAEAFSGANIDNAVVKYRVYRQELFTYWPWYRNIPYGRSSSEEITFGETKTDAEGNYSFDFIAKPYEERKDVDRLYNYRIEVSVTDINGETQQKTSNVKVGDKRLTLDFGLNDRSNVDDLKSFAVSVKNVNDVDQNGKGKIEIYRLQSPNRVLKSLQLNSEIDYNYYSEQEFNKLFPTYAYANQLIPKNWKLGEKVLETSFDTAQSKTIQLDKTNQLVEDYYIVKGYVLDGNEKVEVERIIYIANPEKLNNYTLITTRLNKKEFKVGDEVIVTFKSPEKNVFVNYSINENSDDKIEGVLDLRKSNQVKFKVTENQLGGTALSYFVVYNNNYESDKVDILVPMESKDLKITTSVFRDKLLPGSSEKWQIKIAGNQKDKLSAEVLATMYDASLDQFIKHSIKFNPNLSRSNYLRNYFENSSDSFGFQHSVKVNNIWNNSEVYPIYYHGLNFLLFNFSFNGNSYDRMWRSDDIYLSEASVVAEGNPMPRMKAEIKVAENSDGKELVAQSGGGPVNLNEAVVEPKLDQVQARKVLNETAFFYPNLMTDKDGNVIIEFTAPESLTEWKLMTLAHTKDLKIGYLENRVKTQKELMVVPNAPRFLREGDQVSISTKINNLSDQTLNGTAKLMLFDPFTNEPIDSKFKLNQSTQNFTVGKGNSDQVTWTINVPKNVQAVVYRVVAVAGDFSDGEESALPILTNRMLVTETMPIYIKENQTKTFNFDHLQNNKSTTLDHFKLTFEMTTNPIWNAIFALPYLREYPYECAEQVFARLYGNMVSEKIINSNPKIKAVFDQWNAKGELKSKLQLNEDLKSIILEETPWVRSAESEETQMKQIATLFQLNQMQMEMKSAFDKLSQKQQSNGGFAWFEGGRPNEYITTHIVAGFGNLKKMDVNFEKMNINVNSLVENSIQFIDQENLKRYNEFKKDLKSFKNITYSDGIHYLYARSFFLDQYPMNKDLEEMKNVMLKNLNDKKLNLSLQQKAMAALVLNRFEMQSAAKQTLIAVKEKAVTADEMGMYWKENKSGWFWYDAPVETQAMLIEAFDEVLNDTNSVEEMKVWLLKNKQTNQWNSTKATTKAVYALMNTGKSWIDAEKGVKVNIASQPFDLEKGQQAGSGYVKTTWNSTEIKPELGKVEVSKSSPGIAYGAMYWQYFENLDKIQAAETGIKFNKKLYVKANSVNGPILREITNETPVKVGDIVTVRLEISIDRNMQFVHIKDMRASGFEPVNVLSGYKWKGEFGYYESTRDASTNFFADYIRKGTYVFEYDLKANNAGNFSNGITSMQNMYAPELSAHSEGIRVYIKN